MRFHLFGLANIPTCKNHTWEPMTPLVFNMSKMLKDNGHHVTFYGAAGSDPPCDEFVNIVPQELLPAGLTINDFGVPSAAWHNSPDSPTWQSFVSKGRTELRKRYRTGDIALISFGRYQQFVTEIATLACEIIVGYSGFFTFHKVFPSYAWQHHLYGQMNWERCPCWSDTVIPHYLDLDDFPFQEKKGDYLLCLGRLDRDKGSDIAIDVANRAGHKIIMAGADMVSHDIPDWLKNMPGDVEFTGYVGGEKRLELLRNAKALIHPARWIEPFGLVLIEALACGTPIIGSAFGALPEIIQQGVTGFCCRDMEDFVEAVRNVSNISPYACRKEAEERYSLQVAYPQYLKYFQRMEKLLGNGWYETKGTWRGPAIVERLDTTRPLLGVEIGVDRGMLSDYLLNNLPNLHLNMVDTWEVFASDSDYTRSGDLVTARTQAQRDADLGSAIRMTNHAADRRIILQCISEEASKRIEDGTLDFVFIDADHSYAGVSSDIKLWAPKLRPDGLLCGHDYGMEVYYPQWGVKQAVNEFAAANNLVVEQGPDWTWFIKI